MSYIKPNIKNFKLAEDLNVGDLTQITSNQAYKKWSEEQLTIKNQATYLKVFKLTSTKFIAIYVECSPFVSRGELKARVMTLNGDELTLETEYNIFGDMISVFATAANAAVLDSSKVIVSFTADNAGTYTPRAVVIDITGTVITPGIVVEVENVNTNEVLTEILALSATKALMVYVDQNLSNRRACAMSISGTTITLGTPVTTENTTNVFGPYKLAKTVDDAQAVLIYTATSTMRPTAVVLDVSVLAITVNTPLQLFAVSSQDQSSLNVVALTSTRVLFFCRNSGTNVTGVIGGTISASVITPDFQNTTIGTNIFNQSDFYKISSTRVALLCCISNVPTASLYYLDDVAGIGIKSRLMANFNVNPIVTSAINPLFLNITNITGETYLISFNIFNFGCYVLITGSHGNQAFINSIQGIIQKSGVAGDIVPVSIINAVRQ